MAQQSATTLKDFGGFLKPEMAQPYFDEMKKSSVAQQLFRQVPLSTSGEAIPVTTSKPTASWVAEAGQKPTTSGGKSLVTMEPKKIAAISVVSAEVVRANPGGYMDDLRADIAEAFALAFDAAVFHGTGSPFAANLAQTSKAVTLGTAAADKGGVWADVNAGLKLLVDSGKRLRASVFDMSTEPLFNAAVDTTGRPLFTDSATSWDSASNIRDGRMLGRPAYFAETVKNGQVVGFAGDTTKAVWGVVGGITYDVSTQATVTLNGEPVSLFEHNLVAVRAEAEFGFVLQDAEAFVKFQVGASA